MKTLSTILVTVVYILYKGEEVFTGSVTKRIAEDNENNNKINTTKSDNFTGLYIISHEDGHYLCNAYNIIPPEWNFTETYNASTDWYSFEDQVKVPFRISYNHSQHTECLNETNLRYSEIVMKKIVCISISNNFLVELKNFTFVRFHNLRYLDLSHNYISSIASSAFYNLTHLRTLDLSSNRLSTLDLDDFLSSVMVTSGSRKLDYIDISYNRISIFRCEASWSYESEFFDNNLTLDISYNDISTIDQTCSDRIETYYKNVTIVMNGIPLNCNCSSSQNSTSTSMNADLHNCTCPRPEAEFTYSLKLTHVQAFFLALFLSLPVAAFMIYVFVRKKGVPQRIASQLCSGTFCTNVIKNIKKNHRTAKTSKTSSYVYIVASAKDSDMIDTFVSELEIKRNIPVIFKERDEIPGYFKLDLFRKWIHLSTRTVFFINSNFFRDSDCTHIFNLAKTIELAESRVIVVIIKLTDDVKQTDAERMSDLLLSNSIFLDYTPSVDFWDKLVDIIKNNEIHVHVSNTG